MDHIILIVRLKADQVLDSGRYLVRVLLVQRNPDWPPVDVNELNSSGLSQVQPSAFPPATLTHI